MSELELMSQHLRQPKYVHVLVNPLPLYGLVMGILALNLGLFLRGGASRLPGLLLVALACLSAWPASHYGHAGYDRVYAMSDADARQWLDIHAARANWVVYVYYITALLAVAAVALPKRWATCAGPMAVATLVAAVTCLGLGGWAAHAGGQIRHSEFREGPPAIPAKPHAHPREGHHHEH